MDSTTRTLTRQDLTAAVAAVRAKAHTERQHECIDHATTWLSQFGGRAWTLKTSYVTIKSETSERVYRLDLDTLHCTCPSTVACWHLAIAVILNQAARLHQSTMPRLTRTPFTPTVVVTNECTEALW